MGWCRGDEIGWIDGRGTPMSRCDGIAGVLSLGLGGGMEIRSDGTIIRRSYMNPELSSSSVGESELKRERGWSKRLTRGGPPVDNVVGLSVKLGVLVLFLLLLQ